MFLMPPAATAVRESKLRVYGKALDTDAVFSQGKRLCTMHLLHSNR